MYYDFTNVHHVNENNALECANLSMHYISLKHEPYIKMYKYEFFMTENWTNKQTGLVSNEVRHDSHHFETNRQLPGRTRPLSVTTCRCRAGLSE